MVEQQQQHHPDIADTNAWASLLGLLSLKEYFVTVDHSVLWQRHVAWAKPKGEDLRQYVTQRFASNMIVLSLMLGAQINVFFNSSKELLEMRALLGTEKYYELRYWVGILIILDAVVTIMALIATFTLWGMISSISNSNTHALLRSSIGQYVISMPPRFVVAALYLFIFWLVLFVTDLLSGPAKIILPLVVMFLFFQVVLPLSSFGRLIIHTGAMAKRRVLEEDFEKELLPSGLHASLLIRATGQRRKYSSAIYQYRKKSIEDSLGVRSSTRSTSTSTRSRRNTSNNSTLGEEDLRSPTTTKERNDSAKSVSSSSSVIGSTEEEQQILDTVERLFSVKGKPPLNTKRSTHKRTVSGDVYFPRASILNSATYSSNLSDIVQQALSESEREDDEEEQYDDVEEGRRHPCSINIVSPSSSSIKSDKSDKESPSGISISLPPSGEVSVGTAIQNHHNNNASPSSNRLSTVSSTTRGSSHRRPTLTKQRFLVRDNNSKSLLNEWAEEKSVRDLYADDDEVSRGAVLSSMSRNDSMISSMVEEEDVFEDIAPHMSSVSPNNHRRQRRNPSFYNRVRGWESLQNFAFREELDTPESSDDDRDAGGPESDDEKKFDEYEPTSGGSSSLKKQQAYHHYENKNEDETRLFGEQASLLGNGRRGSVQYYNN